MPNVTCDVGRLRAPSVIIEEGEAPETDSDDDVDDDAKGGSLQRGLSDDAVPADSSTGTHATPLVADGGDGDRVHGTGGEDVDGGGDDDDDDFDEDDDFDSESVGWCAVCMLRVMSLQCHKLAGDVSSKSEALTTATSTIDSLTAQVDKV